MEWEGFGRAQQRPGWLHPAVYVLTAACYSYDIERRRMQPGARGVAQERLMQLRSQTAWAASWAWSACRGLVARFAG